MAKSGSMFDMLPSILRRSTSKKKISPSPPLTITLPSLDSQMNYQQNINSTSPLSSPPILKEKQGFMRNAKSDGSVLSCESTRSSSTQSMSLESHNTMSYDTTEQDQVEVKLNNNNGRSISNYEIDFIEKNKKLQTVLTSSIPSHQENIRETNKGDDIKQVVAPNTYNVIDGLGMGGFATVVKVEENKSKKQYAMKVICKKKMKKLGSRQYRKQLAFEVEAMSILDSPFIIKLYDTFENRRNVFLILELCQGGDLYYHLCDMLSKNSNSKNHNHVIETHGIAEISAKIILAELYLALEHLHSHNIIHRDIKSENIMFDLHGHLKLIDFGMSFKLDAYDSHQPFEVGTGSVIYASPEMINERAGGRHSDWWAYGVLAYELFCGKTPWVNLHDAKLIRIEIISKKVIPPHFITKNAQKFMNGLLTKDYYSRLGTKDDIEIKNSLFFKSIPWNKMLEMKYSSAFNPGIVSMSEKEKEDVLHAYNELCSPVSASNSSRTSRSTWDETDTPRTPKAFSMEMHD